MRILVTYAVQGEFTELKFPGLIGEEEVQVGYLRTGDYPSPGRRYFRMPSFCGP